MFEHGQTTFLVCDAVDSEAPYILYQTGPFIQLIVLNLSLQLGIILDFSFEAVCCENKRLQFHQTIWQGNQVFPSRPPHPSFLHND
jgi:hypothetical protein